MTPLVSVLIPMYNAGIGIQKTLESIRRQTFTDYEVVIANDGSTDNSADLARTVFPQATIIDQANTGITGALNRGIQHCRGEFIARIDCNDLATPRRFEWQVEALLENADVGAVGGHIMLYEKDGSDLGICKYPTCPEDAEREMLFGNAPVTHTGVMLRKSVLQTVGGYDPFYNGREDIELWTRISLVSRITNVDQVVMRVLSTKEGISYNAIYLYPLIELALKERVERKENGVKWQNQQLRNEYRQRIRQLQEQKLTPAGKRKAQALFYGKRAGFLLRSGQRKPAAQEYFHAVASDITYWNGWLGLFSSILLPARAHTWLLDLYKNMRHPAAQGNR